MEDQVTGEQGYGVMVDQAYMIEQPSLPVADGSVEVPPSEAPQTMDVSVAAMDVSVPEEAPSMMDASALTEQQIDGSNSSTVPIDDMTDVQPQLEEPTVLTEEDRLWNVVKTNPADFSAWTSLIQEVDKLDIIERIHRVYDTFLAEFPLCYGYWKKYADHESRLGSHESMLAVYERAVQAVTYSVDIWMHYCSYVMSKQEDPDEIRSCWFFLFWQLGGTV